MDLPCNFKYFKYSCGWTGQHYKSYEFRMKNNFRPFSFCKNLISFNFYDVVSHTNNVIVRFKVKPFREQIVVKHCKWLKCFDTSLMGITHSSVIDFIVVIICWILKENHYVEDYVEHYVESSILIQNLFENSKSQSHSIPPFNT